MHSNVIQINDKAQKPVKNIMRLKISVYIKNKSSDT